MSQDEIPVKLVSSYEKDLHWLRGNLHTHTTMSDGAREPETVIKDYEAREYDFLSLSDHDVLVNPDAYRSITKMTLIPGVEITANGPHILHVNPQSIVSPHEDRQKVLDEVGLQPESFAVLNHPNWLAPLPDLHFSDDHMRRLTGYLGIEIYNGVIERLSGSAVATDRWDRLLSNGLRVWGFGHDDSHTAEDVGLSWVMVQGPDSDADSILSALRAGRFYSSTGVDITSIQVKENRVAVYTSNATRIRFITKWGVIQKSIESQAADYILPDDPKQARALKYIRIECYGGGCDVAWTQPIWIE